MRLVLGLALTLTLSIIAYYVLSLWPSIYAPGLTGESLGREVESQPEELLSPSTSEFRSGTSDRHALAEADSTEPESSANAVADDRLTGVVLDEHEQPVASARVALDYRGSGGMNILDLAYARERHPVGEILTNESGSFAFDVEPGLSMRLTAYANRHSRAIVEEAFGGEHHVLHVTAAAMLRGTITRAADGTPAQGVDIRVWSESTRRTWGEQRTGPNGQYKFEDLPPDVVMMSVESPELMDADWATFELEAGEQTVRDYALLDGVVIHGRVTDAQSGLPIEDCEVGAGWTFAKLVLTDSDGHYELRGFGCSGVYEIHVRSKNYGTAVQEYAYDALPTEDQELDFVLQPARKARGRVIGLEGLPIEGVYAAAIASVHGDDGERSDWTSTSTNATGDFELDSLDPEGWHYLYLRKRGFGSLVYHFPEREKDQAVTDFGTLTLPHGGRLSGRVVDVAGEPLAGVKVRLVGTNADRMRFRSEGGTRADISNVQRQSTTSGQGGRFHFIDLAPGRYPVHAQHSRNVMSETVIVDVDSAKEPASIELIIDLGLSISGRVVSVLGEPVVGMQVRAVTGNRSERVTCSTRAGGSFLLQGLKDQPYDLVADTMFIEDSHRLVSTTIYRNQPAGVQDLRLVLDVPSIISGQVLARDGQPAVKPFINATQYEHHLDFSMADDEGHFTLSVPSLAIVRITATATRPSANSFGRDYDPEGGSAELEIAAGSEGLIIRLLKSPR